MVGYLHIRPGGQQQTRDNCLTTAAQNAVVDPDDTRTDVEPALVNGLARHGRVAVVSSR